MQLRIIGIGRLKKAPERELCETYIKRFAHSARPLGFGDLSVVEREESKKPTAEARKAEEADAIGAHYVAGQNLIVLDETGDDMSSRALADLLNGWKDDGVPCTTFVIGGPDGLAPEIRQSATRIFRFGRMTWPHRLVRVMILEQLYRSATILANHPYHRD